MEKSGRDNEVVVAKTVEWLRDEQNVAFSSDKPNKAEILAAYDDFMAKNQPVGEDDPLVYAPAGMETAIEELRNKNEGTVVELGVSPEAENVVLEALGVNSSSPDVLQKAWNKFEENLYETDPNNDPEGQLEDAAPGAIRYLKAKGVNLLEVSNSRFGGFRKAA